MRRVHEFESRTEYHLSIENNEMPIKYKDDIVKHDRSTGKFTTERFFVKSLQTPELIEEFTRCRTPKIKAKFRNELYKRGFTQQTIAELTPAQ